ncbi:hypothetical protein N7508_000902 [Penicillium antarcticum]|uniref:uncharacterized protein n=1 Tax=Penicillium antarcticum TaxID=416450 RepID=UPI002399BAF1|nr:uncharacterized protein N7508_000902 [Penicillium antarcticum]KAJ5320619.1 hypothetical protein N7508_000902 [Penicillium antarcticum]
MAGCVKELRDKASDFKRTGYIAVFDTDSRVIKSQVHNDLLKELQESMSPLFSASKSVSSTASVDPNKSVSESPGLISAAIEPWNEMLILGDQGRTPIRIRTYDFQVEGGDDETKLHNYMKNARQGRTPPITEEEWPDIRSRIREHLRLPEPEKRHRILPDSGYHDLLAVLEKLVIAKSRRLYAVKGIEPGISFTYDEWKTGENTGRAIMPKWSDPDKLETPPIPDLDHDYYSISLQDQFEGLQIIVRGSTIELTLEEPLYYGDSHHNVAGILNEHIVSTAVCYFDMHNIKDAKVSFQQETHIESDDFNIAEYDVMNRVFDVPSWSIRGDDPCYPEALQTIGSIPISRNGQFLAWPSTLRSKAEPFSMADRLRPGHLRFATLWLVGPHYRICSTQNVPPQDPSWVETSQSTKDAPKHDLMAFTQAVEARNQMRQDRDRISEKFLERGHSRHIYSEVYIL